ncbi:hypothetical protein ABER68_24940 [Paenibacillus alvei]
MFIKMYCYHIPKENVEEYLNIQEQAAEIYKTHLDFHTMYFNSTNDETKWIEISRYNNEIDYKESVGKINKNQELQDLFQRFEALLINKTMITEEEFTELKSICTF